MITATLENEQTSSQQKFGGFERNTALITTVVLLIGLASTFYGFILWSRSNLVLHPVHHNAFQFSLTSQANVFLRTVHYTGLGFMVAGLLIVLCSIGKVQGSLLRYQRHKQSAKQVSDGPREASKAEQYAMMYAAATTMTISGFWLWHTDTFVHGGLAPIGALFMLSGVIAFAALGVVALRHFLHL